MKRTCTLLLLNIILLIGPAACGNRDNLPAATVALPAVVMSTSTPVRLLDITTTPLPVDTPTALPTVVPTSTLTSTPAATVDGLVTKSRISLRIGPGLSYPVYAEAIRGGILRVLARNQDSTWMEIRAVSERHLWVPSYSVRLSLPIDSLPLATDIQEPPPAIIAWKGDPVQRVCLRIEQSYPEKPADYSLPGEKIIRQIMTGINLQPVGPADFCDAYFTMKLTGTALGAYYPGFTTPTSAGKSKEGKVYCYAGANLKGFFELMTDTRNVLLGSQVNTNINPPPTVNVCKANPGSVSYNAVLAKVILDSLSSFWDARVLSYALHHGSEGIGEPYLQEYATIKLKQLGPQAKDAIPGLIQAIEDPESDATVRQAALEALGSVGKKTAEVVPVLVGVLNNDQYWEVRGAAIEALGNIGPITPEVIPALTQALKGDNSKEAVRALGTMGPAGRAAIPALIDLMRISWSREAIGSALENITGRKYGANYSDWLRWWQEQNK